MKVTVPSRLACGTRIAETAAVKVTLWPMAAKVFEDERVVCVGLESPVTLSLGSVYKNQSTPVPAWIWLL